MGIFMAFVGVALLACGGAMVYQQFTARPGEPPLSATGMSEASVVILTALLVLGSIGRWP